MRVVEDFHLVLAPARRPVASSESFANSEEELPGFNETNPAGQEITWRQ
jgi:hypothetical protein